jgi:hypothetical protein
LLNTLDASPVGILTPKSFAAFSKASNFFSKLVLTLVAFPFVLSTLLVRKSILSLWFSKDFIASLASLSAVFLLSSALSNSRLNLKYFSSAFS